MNRSLVIGGVIFLLLLAIVGSVVGYFVYNGPRLDESSKAYVDTNVPIIVSSWSKEELLKRSSPQLLAVVNKSPEQIDQLFKKLSTLGAMQHYEGSKGQAYLFFNYPQGKSVTAKYVADAKFEHGEANIQIQLVQTSGEWQIINFHVNSPIFLQ